MLTVGVDLAAEPPKTAVACIEWSSGAARVSQVETRADDGLILDAIASADKAGIDCPFGWPDAFVDFVAAHRAGNLKVPDGVTGLGWRRDLTLRVTDQVTYEQTGLLPLRVSADRIGHTAMRCAGLLAALAHRGQPVDRSGAGVVVEVYPAASLKLWGLTHRRYKGKDKQREREHLVGKLKDVAPWLDLSSSEQQCLDSDDVLDAVIAALTARAANLGKTISPPPQHLTTARTEGWIALPTTALPELRT